MLRIQQAGAQNRQIAQAIEIHRFLRNPWIPAQSMDPQIAQRDPWKWIAPNIGIATNASIVIFELFYIFL